MMLKKKIFSSFGLFKNPAAEREVDAKDVIVKLRKVAAFIRSLPPIATTSASSEADKMNAQNLTCQRLQTGSCNCTAYCGVYLSAQRPASEQAYPTGIIVGPCICGSWPGGECLRCRRVADPKSQRLTDDEARKLIMAHFGRDSMVFIRAIETAFAAKNGITLADIGASTKEQRQ